MRLTDGIFTALCARNYAKKIKKIVEPSIAQGTVSSLRYARYLLRGPFPLGEAAIARDAGCSFDYAKQILHGRFELGEPAIAESAMWSFHYASAVLHGPFPLGEDAIAEDGGIYTGWYAQLLAALKQTP